LVILKRKVKCHVSNIQQFEGVIMEEWKRIAATPCAALVNSVSRKIKTGLSMVLTQNTLDTVLSCSARVNSLLLPVL